ncbi:TlpA family protein disulfide reductase [Myroides sp. LJL119]
MKNKKKTKSLITNLLFLVGFLLIAFTPLGTSIKVWVNTLVAMSPSLEDKEDQEKVQYNNWILIDENGQQLDFSTLNSKVVIINFWATWCPPCLAEKPSFQELYNDYADKVEFLFVTDQSPEEVQKFKQKNNYSLPIYYAQNPAPAVLYSKTIPASYVIDKKGNIVVKKFRAADWNSAKFRVILDDLLQGPINSR